MDRRTWFDLPFGPVDLDQTMNPAVDDGLGLGLDGGVDFNDDGPLRTSLEFGGSWSDHDISAVSDDLEVFRLTSGLRVTARSKQLPLGAYIRGGRMWRSEDLDSDLGHSGDDQFGWYWGGGFEWWFDATGSLGPFIMFSRGDDDDVEERWVGFAARFYLGEV